MLKKKLSAMYDESRKAWTLVDAKQGCFAVIPGGDDPQSKDVAEQFEESWNALVANYEKYGRAFPDSSDYERVDGIVYVTKSQVTVAARTLAALISRGV